MPACILIVEDERKVRELVSEIVRHYGFRVLVAKDGQQALSMARDEQPSAILLDTQMPGINGIDVCRTLKEDVATSQIKIIMLTSLNDEATRKLAFEAGSDEYMTKPFTGRVLFDSIEDILIIAD